MSKFTEVSWQWLFAVYSKQWKSSSNFKAFFCTKKCFERIPCDIYIFWKEFACKFAHWFSSIFQSLQMHCRIFCNLADSFRLLVSKKIRKSWSSQPKIKPTTCGYLGPGILEKPKKLRLFSHKKKSLRLKLRWPTVDMLQIKKLLQIK